MNLVLDEVEESLRGMCPLIAPTFIHPWVAMNDDVVFG